MGTQPRVTVLIPVYNREKFVAAAIESVPPPDSWTLDECYSNRLLVSDLAGEGLSLRGVDRDLGALPPRLVGRDRDRHRQDPLVARA